MTASDDKTLGIVLTTVKLNDHTQLVHFYTQSKGRVTCRVPLASRGKRASQLRNMITPMSVLELVLGGHPSDAIRPIAEARIVQSPYLLTLDHPDKSAQCLYMAELVAHTIREEEAEPRLWNYLTASLEVLEHCEAGWENFHLVFTCGLTRLLGFSVDTSLYTPGCCFDMIEGTFTTGLIPHAYYFNAESSKWFCRMVETQYDTMHQLSFSPNQRAAMLDMLLAFLAQQIPEMGQLRSVDVLKTLFN